MKQVINTSAPENIVTLDKVNKDKFYGAQYSLKGGEANKYLILLNQEEFLYRQFRLTGSSLIAYKGCGQLSGKTFQEIIEKILDLPNTAVYEFDSLIDLIKWQTS